MPTSRVYQLGGYADQQGMPTSRVGRGCGLGRARAGHLRRLS
ncbi:MAG TPA: hypothetical protein VFJ22_21015 [Dermatophilaceae bacterium]|nr:hypothetical protein [Dermatophilaceae bacterium]